ncbi:hypothetical protein A0H81_11327 [Grifola frondosa]|uniref:Uncharacterized protein n=1 Tax=Grifola frondosa TaxID=5627 RepID=A0A1C7LVH2_GRIFR|nr:hypothetical protein A0H81_11327 [Grifola frondosa]
MIAIKRVDPIGTAHYATAVLGASLARQEAVHKGRMQVYQRNIHLYSLYISMKEQAKYGVYTTDNRTKTETTQGLQ